MSEHHHTSFWKSPSGFAAIGLIVAASYFLLVEHREHVLPLLPYFILLLCPLMHIFMHGSHGGHGSDKDHDHSKESDEEAYRRGLEDGKKQSTNQHNH